MRDGEHGETGSILAIVASAVVALVCLFVLIGVLIGRPALAAGVPEACRQFQRAITAQAHNVFGLQAPIADIAAQVQQESSCNPDARSPYASGLTQFTPGTAKWLAQKYPHELGGADPTNVQWAIAAQSLYMRDLTTAHPGKTACDTWAFGLSSYNGGEGWLQRDMIVCGAEPRCPSVIGRQWPENAFTDVLALIVLYSDHELQTHAPTKSPCGCDRSTWFNNVELTPDRRRSNASIAENRGYPRRILLELEPKYIAADYGPGVMCRVP